jgi:L,D-transpeptidase-like protein
VRILITLATLFALLTLACSAKANTPSSGGVVIEPAASGQTPVVGGKPDPQTVAANAPAGSAPAAAAAPDTPAPQTGHWIDVDVTHYRVRLMDGTQALKTIEPVAVGAQVDTGAYESTQTGLFHVYNKVGGLQYDPPYKTYFSDWVGFDMARANGFHSFLKDERGNIVNPGTGRISNGCIRTGDPAAIFAFAEVGMPVYVHS